MSWDGDVVEVLAHEPSFVPDVYFAHGYGVADALNHGGTWITVADSAGRWQMPLVLADVGDGTREAISPYGYAGIHVADDMTTTEAADAWASARDGLKGLGVASLFLRFNPLDTSSVTAARRFDDLTVERIRTTYLVTIGEPEHMWDRLRSSCRSRIRKARKNGYTGLVRSAGAADLAPGSAFRRLYEQTMHRRSATPQYYFSDDYYVELLAGLGSDLLLSEVHDHDAEVVSSCLLMRHQGSLHYHLAGSDPDGAVMGSNNLMMWTAAEFAFELGLDRFHLGGGRAEFDGLARFKSTFGADTRDFHVGRAIIDSEAYSRLTRARADQLGTTVDALEQTEYFPAFRASVG
jgi:hypothetical protein